MIFELFITFEPSWGPDPFSLKNRTLFRCKYTPVGNGWLCNTCSDTATKFSQISEISNKLGLNLKVELI